jgi:predicted DNA-binding transcriptional regulator AlpA
MTTNDSLSRFLRTPEAARYLGLSSRTLEKHRTYGTGPVYRKLGGRIVYDPEDLKAWADRGVRRSTSDPGNGTVHPAKRQEEPPPAPPRTRPNPRGKDSSPPRQR